MIGVGFTTTGCGKLRPPAAGTKPVMAASRADDAVGVLDEIAEVLEGVNDKAAFEAAKPKLAAIGPRYRDLKPVIVTAVYLAKLTPNVPADGREQLARQTRTNPEFQPYLTAAEDLVRHPDFSRAYRRYLRAEAAASPHTGGTDEVMKAMGTRLGE
jgi:hypothetical protein